MTLPMLTIFKNTFGVAASRQSRRGRARFALACVVAFAIGASTLAFAQDKSAAEEIRAGILAYQFSNYQGAAEHFQAALKLDPASTQARVLLANSYADRKSTRLNSSHLG